MCLEHIMAEYVKVFCPPRSDFRYFAIGEKQDIFLHIKKTKDTEIQKYIVISQFEQGCIPLSSYKLPKHYINILTGC